LHFTINAQNYLINNLLQNAARHNVEGQCCLDKDQAVPASNTGSLEANE
jgi:hypothetical protein